MGIKAAASSFQNMMQLVLRGLTWNNCLVYLDDIICFSRMFEQHICDLNDIFKRLRQANLRLKIAKCNFACKEIKYLGHIISNTGIRTNPELTDKIRNYPTPTNLKQLRGFVGLAQYYRKFIRDFSIIARPLYDLTKKAVKFTWTAECAHTFEILKDKLCSAPILAYPDFNKQFILYCDASLQGIGYILSQTRDGGEGESVIAYAGRGITPRERKYGISELEALSVVSGVKHFDPYLRHSKFQIVTDHNCLTYLFGLNKPAGRLGRWSITLQMYDYTIIHRPGKIHQNTDALSRMPHPPLQENDVIYDDDMIGIIAMQLPSENDQVKIATPDITVNVADLQRQDISLKQLIDCIQDKPTLPDTKKMNSLRKRVQNYVMENDKLYYVRPKTTDNVTTGNKKLLVIPESLKMTVLRNKHDVSTAGHMGVSKTISAIKAKYYWSSINKDVEVYIASCHKCLTKKTPKRKYVAPLIPIVRPVELRKPWASVTVDYVGPLHKSASGNKYLCVFICNYTRWPEAYATPDSTAETTANLLFNEIFCKWGAPRILLSDRGQCFLSKVVAETCKLLKIHKSFASPYRPQTSGSVEKLNGVIVQGLSMFVDDQQTNWDTFLPAVLMGIRVSKHESTKFSPYAMNFGREAELPMDINLLDPPPETHKSIPECVSDLQKKLHLIHEIADTNIQLAQEKMKRNFDKKARPVNFEVGDLVYLKTPKVKPGLSKKLQKLWSGPFKLIEKSSPVNFYIRDVENLKKTKGPIHVNRFKMIKARAELDIQDPAPTMARESADNSITDITRNDTTSSAVDTPPTPTTSDNKKNSPADIPRNSIPPPAGKTPTSNKNTAVKFGKPTRRKRRPQEKFFAIEKILDSRVIDGEDQYLIHWRGFPSSADSWEPKCHLNKQALAYIQKSPAASD